MCVCVCVCVCVLFRVVCNALARLTLSCTTTLLASSSSLCTFSFCFSAMSSRLCSARHCSREATNELHFAGHVTHCTSNVPHTPLPDFSSKTPSRSLTHACTHARAHARTHAHTPAHPPASMHACPPTHLHTHTRTHTHHARARVDGRYCSYLSVVVHRGAVGVLEAVGQFCDALREVRLDERLSGISVRFRRVRLQRPQLWEGGRK